MVRLRLVALLCCVLVSTSAVFAADPAVNLRSGAPRSTALSSGGRGDAGLWNAGALRSFAALRPAADPTRAVAELAPGSELRTADGVFAAVPDHTTETFVVRVAPDGSRTHACVAGSDAVRRFFGSDSAHHGAEEK